MTTYKFHDLSLYCQPGIFRIDSKSNGCTLFGESDNVFLSMLKIKDQLFDASYDNSALLNDFQTYGLRNFEFTIVVCGPEWSDIDKRKNALQELKETWGLSLY
jgi:hypothetical protein